MFNKKFLSVILGTALLASTVSVAAAGFSDVDSDKTVEWAVPYITEMAEQGYIKGYEDGTFRPKNTISKTEALILLARMIGVNDDSFADSVELAVSEYSSVLSKYTTNYAREISFLLYTGVLNSSELDTYISASNKNAALQRYEAAVLLTKLLGAEEEVKNSAFVSSSYADTVEIPDSARAYVEYVKEVGIMEGMGNNAAGAPVFSPNTSVTRAQMAKMLCCLIDVIDRSVQEGTVVSTDSFNETITVTIDGTDIVNTVSGHTAYKIDGKAVALSDITKGMHVKIAHVAGVVSLVEKQTLAEDCIIYGLVSSTSSSNNLQSVTIVDANDSSIKETYVLAENAKIRVGGAVDLFSKVKANNYVALTIEDGLVTVLEVVEKSSTVYGTLKSVDISGDYTVLNIADNDGNLVSYETASEEVGVTRNGLNASISELAIGDSLSLKLTYGKITKIQASSSTSTKSGRLSYITYSTEGAKIGVEISGSVTEYKVNKSVNVIIDSVENSSIYDLRAGTDIDIKLESSEVVKIEAAGAVLKSQLSGTVTTVNSTYGLLVVTEGGTDYNVFVSTSTKIIDSTSGRTVLLKNIEKGSTVSVTGSTSSGVLEASVIVIQ